MMMSSNPIKLPKSQLLRSVCIPLALFATSAMGQPAGEGPDVPAALNTLALGEGFQCYVTSNREIECWGTNDKGQLGNGSVSPPGGEPTRVFGLRGVRAVTAGQRHACALLSDRTVRCWGENEDGQLGIGHHVPVAVIPLQVSGLQDVSAITAGTSHTCALTRDGRVHCWGENEDGQLGAAGGSSNAHTPRRMPVTGAIAVTAGARHSCALLENGSVRCWGANNRGQLGSGTASADTGPVDVAGISHAVSIAAGSEHTCALLADGSVRCWGNNWYGQLGNGFGLTIQPSPQRAVGISTGKRILAGRRHTCAIDDSGDLLCWGSNMKGQLGIGSNAHFFVPMKVSGIRNVVTAAVSATRSCAITALGRIYCWGDDVNAPAPPSGGARLTPYLPDEIRKSAAAPAWSRLSAGNESACAITEGGNLYCWGKFPESRPEYDPDATMPAINDVVSVAAGWGSDCALTRSGEVHCWGAGANGQLGNGGTAEKVLNPISASVPPDTIALWRFQMSPCVSDLDGQLFCWGANGSGQASPSSDGPKKILTPEAARIGTVRWAANGYRHTCAALADGTVRCWGSDENQRTDASGLTGVQRVALGDEHSCALTGEGEIWCWGNNEKGQLGNGTTSESSGPVQVLFEGRFVSVTTFHYHTCGIDSEGQAWCWGANGQGQLGDGTTTSRSEPVRVLHMTQTTEISAGANVTCARRESGNIWCWGSNANGLLGPGSQDEKSAEPVRVNLPSDLAHEAPRPAPQPEPEGGETPAPETDEPEDPYDDEF